MEFHKLLNEVNLHFRGPITLSIVWICWGFDVLAFEYFKLDYCKVLGFNRNTALTGQQIILSGILMLLCIVCFRLLFSIWFPSRLAFFIPISVWILGLAILFWPWDAMHRVGRKKLLHIIYRLIVPLKSGVIFVEVVLGDILTSLSKAMSDIQISWCVLMGSPLFASSRQGPAFSSTLSQLSSSAFEERCAESIFRPLITSIPFLIRFRQCLVNYRATGDAFPHLVNAAKYASSFPVIWLSAMAHLYGDSYSIGLRRAWLISISFNSFFSFMWDVLMDWGFCRNGTRFFMLRDELLYINNNSTGYQHVSQLVDSDNEDAIDGTDATIPVEPDSPSKSHSKMANMFAPNALERNCDCNSPALREKINMFTNTPFLYYLAIVLDFVFRVLWSFKLSVHLQLSQGGLTFILEICEVLRRAVWLLIRIEWQVIEENVHMEESFDIELSHNLPSDVKTPSPSKVNTPADGWSDALPSATSTKDQLRARIQSDRIRTPTVP